MNTLIIAIFVAFSILILGSAVMVVTVNNIVHAALWLIATFFGVGALYLLMEAEFVAIVQVLIYVGAVSILILFAIMLTREVAEDSTRATAPRRWWATLVIVGALFGLLIVPTVYQHQWRLVQPAAQPEAISSTVQIGTAFMREYLLPFEVASVLLLVALVGAIVIAFEDRSTRRRVLTLAEEWRLRRGGQEPQVRSQEPESLKEAGVGNQESGALEESEVEKQDSF